MKEWLARGGTTSNIVQLIFTAPDEDAATEMARQHFGNDDFDLEPYEAE